MPELLITRPDQLRALARSRPRPRPRVVLDPAMGGTDLRRARLQRQINASLSACGCNEGTAAGLLYIITMAALAWRGTVSLGGTGWLLALAAFALSLVAGKATGLLLARLRLWRAIRAVHTLSRRATSAP